MIWNVIILLMAAPLSSAGDSATPPSAESPDFLLKAQAQVDSQGVFLDQIVETSLGLPHVRIAPAPALGQSVTLARADLLKRLEEQAPDLKAFSIGGAAAVKITRKTRAFDEAELLTRLTELLQRDTVKEKGKLDLHTGRSWTSLQVPDEDITVKIIELPPNGISPNFIARVELRLAEQSLGTWSLALKARVLQPIWVARTPVGRRQSLADADVVLEERDLLNIREPLCPVDPKDPAYEIAEPIPAGSPLYARSVRLRPVVQRGKVVDAQVQDGALVITAKAEALEEGAPGQYIRVRNLKSKKEFRGKVQDEQTVLVNM